MKKYYSIYFFIILVLGRVIIPKIVGGTMDTSNVVLIVVAIISLIGVVVSSHLSENSKWKKVDEKLEKLYSSLNEKISATNKDIGVDENRVCLSKQHENMKKTLSIQNSEIKSIIDSKLNSANSMLDGLYSKMKKDENEASIQKAVLAASGRSLNDFVNDTKCFSKLYADEVKNKDVLSAEIENLKKQNTELSKMNSELKKDIEDLKKQNSKLSQELENLSSKRAQKKRNSADEHNSKQKTEQKIRSQEQNDCDLTDDAEDEEFGI